MPGSTVGVRLRPAPPQVGLTASQRKRNVVRLFGPARRAESRLTGSQVLLVDDVVTTGATVRACSRVLLDAGARSVAVVALAYAPP